MQADRGGRVHLAEEQRLCHELQSAYRALWSIDPVRRYQERRLQKDRIERMKRVLSVTIHDHIRQEECQ